MQRNSTSSLSEVGWRRFAEEGQRVRDSSANGLHGNDEPWPMTVNFGLFLDEKVRYLATVRNLQ